MHPGNSKRPEGKLRLLYECMPLAFIAEQAGGFAHDGRQRILERRANSIHDRTALFVGSKTEQELLVRFLSPLLSKS
jgi:fructose-1,6-bisphosphatase I